MVCGGGHHHLTEELFILVGFSGPKMGSLAGYKCMSFLGLSCSNAQHFHFLGYRVG